MRLNVLVFATVAAVFHCTTAENGFQECFDRDSISCLQTQVFRIGRKIFENPAVKLFGGLYLAKDEGSPSGRSFEATDEPQDFDRQFSEANSFSERQSVLEEYFQQQVAGLWRNRTLRFDALEAGKTLLKVATNGVKLEARNLQGEARGKQKMMKMMVPLMIAMKLKFLAFMKLAALVVVVLSKKAIVAAVLSVFISSYLGLKALLHKNKTNHHHIDYHAYEVPSSYNHAIGYSGHGYNGYNAYPSYAASKSVSKIGAEIAEITE